jgi:hypothetical protein
MIPHPVVGSYLFPNLFNNPRCLMTGNDRIIKGPVSGVEPLFQGANAAVGYFDQYVSRSGKGFWYILHHYSFWFL